MASDKVLYHVFVKLVVVRHGQTDWNVEERYQGRLDVPLNRVGVSQADALKRDLAGLRFDMAYSSPLRRAVETARIIVGDVPLIADERLTEIHHGEWQGKTRVDIQERWPDQWQKWITERESFTPPGGESVALVRSRIEDFLATIRGTTILCVSHGIVIQTFLSILGRDACVPGNASVHTFFL